MIAPAQVTAPSVGSPARRRWLIYAITLSAPIFPACESEEASTDAGRVETRIDSAMAEIESGIGAALSDNDLLLEKNLRELKLAGETLRFLAKEPDLRTLGKALPEIDQATIKFSDLVAHAKGGLLDLSEFASLNPSGLFNKLPLRQDAPLVSDVDGYGIQYSETGSYAFSIRGSAFGVGDEATVKIDGETLASDADTPGGTTKRHVVRLPHTFRFFVPTRQLNSRFDDAVPVRIPIELQITKTTESVVEPVTGKRITRGKGTETTLRWTSILLPRYPIAYQIREKFPVDEFTGETGSTTKSVTMHPVEEGRTEHTTITLTVPGGAKQDGGFQFQIIPADGDCGEVPPDSQNASSLTRTFWKTGNRTSHEIIATTKWVKPKQKIESGSVEFPNFSKQENGSRLPHGTHFADLHPRHSMFDATFTYFNNKKVILHTDKKSDQGISATVSASPDGLAKRLVVEIENPYLPNSGGG